MVTVRLPVKAIAMSYGATGEGRTPPATVTVSVPAQWSGVIGAYWANKVLLAPRGWTGSGMEGADGSGNVVLHPAGGSPYTGQRVVLWSDGACFGCGAPTAAEYFKAIREHWSAYEVVPGPPPAMVRVAAEVYLAPDLVAYRLPDTKSGLEVNGVAYTGLIEGHDAISFSDLQTYLPAREHGLATVILNWGIAHDLE
jgi:hypothetical protein